jgi:hypothetical protein
MKTSLKYLLRTVLGFVVILLILTTAGYIWTGRLMKDSPELVRPTYQHFEMGSGAADGSPPPAPNGYYVDGSGEPNILPPMPPEKPMDVHTAANYRKDNQIRDCFWPGPRGRSGVFTNDFARFNIENQFADTGTTYIPVAFIVPPGGKLVLKGQFPHMRHWNFHTYTAAGLPMDAMSDIDFEADPGNVNPFRDGVRRDAPNRNYTLHIMSGEPPAKRPANTLYTYLDAGKPTTMLMRNYVPDLSADYLGSVPLPTLEVHSADGKVLTGQAACDASRAPTWGKQLARTVSPRTWLALSHMPWVDSKNIAAHDLAVQPLAMFFNRFDLVARMFAPGLAKADPKQEGGWWSNKVTRYGSLALSQNFGKVYVMTAKMPVTPRTWNADQENTPHVDMRYLSICTAGSPSSGTTPDCIYDEQLLSTVDSETGRYDVVISREIDRPTNARQACGVAWLEAGNGDGVVGGSPDFMFIVNRHTQVSDQFKQSWFAVKKPGTEKQVMGDYLPWVINMKTKAAFEALGCPVDKKRLHALLGK